MICDRWLYQQRLTSICPAFALLIIASSLQFAPKVYLSEEIVVPAVHAEEKVVDHEVHQLRDAFYLVLPVLASSVLPAEAPPVLTSHC